MLARFAIASAAGGRPARKSGNARGIVPGNMAKVHLDDRRIPIVAFI
jgi:hypothetical protein